MASTTASQAAWNVGSFSSRSTGPNPCIPPRSWTPSIRRDSTSMGARGLGVGGRRLRRHPGVAGAQGHPQVEARPLRGIHVAPPRGVDPRVRQEDGQHLLVPTVPEAQAPGAGPPGPVAVLEERGAGAAAPLGQRGGRGQAGRALVRADAEVEVPGLAALDLDGDVAVQEGEPGSLAEPPLEHRALDARPEDDVLPVLLEHLPEQGEEAHLRALDRKVIGAGPVEILLLGHVSAHAGPPARRSGRADPPARARAPWRAAAAAYAGCRAGTRRSTRDPPRPSSSRAACGRTGPGSPARPRRAGCGRPAG